MPRAKFKGVEYEIPAEQTNREAMEVEHISGYSVAEVQKAMARGGIPYSVLLAWAWIGIKRTGAPVSLDDLLDSPVGSVEWLGDEEEQPQSGPFVVAESDAESPETPATAGLPPSPSSSE